VIRSYVYAAHRFGEWLSKQGLPISAVSDQLISRYIDQFHKRITLAHPYGQLSKLAHGLGHLLVVLQQAGVVVAAKQIPSPTEQWLARYDQYLNQVGGKAAATRKKYLSYARRFWEFRFGSAEADWSSLRIWFARFLRRLNIRSVEGKRRPSLHSFRHGFAVERLKAWQEAGANVQALVPHLAVYLGHVSPRETYWYLSASPELLNAAARSFETFIQSKGAQ
jgi:hypothetical protein